MLEQGCGAIVNVSSNASWMGWADRALFWPAVLTVLGVALLLRRPAAPAA